MFDSPEQSSDEPQGISLDALSRAYADALGGRDPQSAAEESGPADGPDMPPDRDSGDEPAESAPPPEIDADDLDEDPCPISPETIFEAMLFVGDRRNEPLAPARAAELMRGVEPAEIPQLVDQLNRRYEKQGCPYRIAGDGPGYRLVLRGKFDWLRNRLYGRVREAHLSQAAVDVLAIVAYRQPLSSDEVGRLRGTPSGHVLAQLVRRQLLRIERDADKPRKPQYYTTDRFLELFGLESLEELPQAEDVEPR
jgi:segregation and condensation protein B